jgi:hypothetical protein
MALQRVSVRAGWGVSGCQGGQGILGKRVWEGREVPRRASFVRSEGFIFEALGVEAERR